MHDIVLRQGKPSESSFRCIGSQKNRAGPGQIAGNGFDLFLAFREWLEICFTGPGRSAEEWPFSLCFLYPSCHAKIRSGGSASFCCLLRRIENTVDEGHVAIV